MIGDRWNVKDDEVARARPLRRTRPTRPCRMARSHRADHPETLMAVGSQSGSRHSTTGFDNIGRRSHQRSRLAEPVVGESFSTAATADRSDAHCRRAAEHLTGGIIGTCHLLRVGAPMGNQLAADETVTAMSRWLTPGLSSAISCGHGKRAPNASPNGIADWTLGRCRPPYGDGTESNDSGPRAPDMMAGSPPSPRSPERTPALL